MAICLQCECYSKNFTLITDRKKKYFLLYRVINLVYFEIFFPTSAHVLQNCSDPNNGELRWRINEEPSVRSGNNENFSSNLNAVYFPDPVSGSLYRLRMQNNKNSELKKLPFTIPELVTKSPCKSSDGILYSGKKSDNW